MTTPATDAEPGTGRRSLGLWLGPVLAAAFLVVPLPDAVTPEARRTAAVALLMATWWMTEALPLAATALLPLVLFPALGLRTPVQAASPYANPVIFLFLGGFALALATERWNLHRRLALAIVAAVGTRPESLVLGFMLATGFVSMWVSNTATAAMMTPIAIALAELLRPPGQERYPFGIALLLGVAYGATIGGVATVIGTAPNAVFAGAARELLDRPIGFLEWMTVGVPYALVMLPVTWALLVFVLFKPGTLATGAAQALAAQRAALGPMSRGERTTAAVFALMVAGWVLREPKTLGTLTIPGLATVAPGIDDSTIAIAGALLLFLLPADRRGTRVLDWGATRDLPWGVLLLFGGGLSLAATFESSGLTTAIGRAVTGLAGLPPVVLFALVAALFVYLSELASNTAIATMAMPLLAAGAVGMGHAPLVLMAIGAISASAAYMLPVATPPNAIVFGSGYIRMGDMVRAGLWLNLVSIVVITIFAVLLLGPVFG